MHTPITLGVLGILAIALVLLRVFWSRLPPQVQPGLTVCAGLAIAVILISLATGWTFVSHRLYSLLLWCGVAGYGIFLVRFTLLSPRWLTAVLAVVLFVPILSSSIVLPLADLFTRTFAITTVPLDDRLFSVRSIVDRSPIAPSAADLDIYYRPRWLPGLQRRMANVRFFDTQCVASASYAVLQPGHRSVLMACPAPPSELSDASVGNTIVPLR